ncbi:MAG: hypothetical protein GC199_08005 [Alphaproteobacteria bacterium]|nr:hypothetical protein [Alphaproteobacteria bacterium]
MTARNAALLAAAALAMAAGAAQAEEPAIHGELEVEVRYHDVVDTDVVGNDTSDLFTETSAAFEIDWAPWLRTEFGVNFEPVEDLDPDEDRAFEDHGLFLETAKIIIDLDPVELYAGKFTVNFGFDPHIFPGTFGEEPAEEVEVTERVGVGASLAIDGGPLGAIEIGASLFALDTTDLSNSWITNRGRTDVNAGGNGNTEDLANYNLSLDVYDIFEVKGAGLRLAFMHQDAGIGDVEDQDAFMVGAYWDAQIAEEWSLYPIIQVAHSDGALGFGEASSPNAGLSETSASFDLGLYHGGWMAAVGAAQISQDDPVGGDVDIDLYKVSLGYTFDFGLGADVGYLWESEEVAGVTEDTEVFGVRLSYHLHFGEEHHH